MLKRLSMSIAGAGPPTGTSVPSEMGESTITETTIGTRGPRPSLAQVMLSRKFAKRLSMKVADRRTGTLGSSASGLHQEKEPTYRMQPKKKFTCSDVESVVKQVVDQRLEGLKYNPKFCSNIIKSLSDEIKDRVKMMGFERYKIVCVVLLCPRVEQGMMASSRCTWDKDNDTFASYTFKNAHLVCNATVYGIFRE